MPRAFFFRVGACSQRRFFQLKPPDDPNQYPPLTDLDLGSGGGGEDSEAGSVGRLCRCAVALPVTLQWRDPKKRNSKKVWLDERVRGARIAAADARPAPLSRSLPRCACEIAPTFLRCLLAFLSSLLNGYRF